MFWCDLFYVVDRFYFQICVFSPEFRWTNHVIWEGRGGIRVRVRGWSTAIYLVPGIYIPFRKSGITREGGGPTCL